MSVRRKVKSQITRNYNEIYRIVYRDSVASIIKNVTLLTYKKRPSRKLFHKNLKDVYKNTSHISIF